MRLSEGTMVTEHAGVRCKKDEQARALYPRSRAPLAPQVRRSATAIDRDHCTSYASSGDMKYNDCCHSILADPYPTLPSRSKQ